MTTPRVDKNVIYGLYCLCHPGDGLRYVGQTSKGAASRLSGHISTTRHRVKYGKRLYKINRWILKHGYDNIQAAVLEVCLPHELDSAESRWILEIAPDINIKPGGSSSRGWKMPGYVVEARTGTGNPMYGKDRRDLMNRIRKLVGPMSDEQRAIRAERLNLSRTDADWERKRIEGVRRSHATEEYRAAASARVAGDKNPMYGRRYTPEERIALSSVNSTILTEDSVRQMKAEVRTGCPQKVVAEKYGVSPSTVSHIMSGRRWPGVP